MVIRVQRIGHTFYMFFFMPLLATQKVLDHFENFSIVSDKKKRRASIASTKNIDCPFGWLKKVLSRLKNSSSKSQGKIKN
jgi:hypothetical protein